MQAGTGAAGYRYCHACQLITPHRWPEQDKSRRYPHEHDGWMTCALCRSNVPPATPLAASITEHCPDCATIIDYPAGTAMLLCPACQRRYIALDLPPTCGRAWTPYWPSSNASTAPSPPSAPGSTRISTTTTAWTPRAPATPHPAASYPAGCDWYHSIPTASPDRHGASGPLAGSRECFS
jgi:hypothetical protein